MRYFFALILFLSLLNSQAQFRNIQGTQWRNLEGMAASFFEFDSTGNVVHRFRGCMSSWERFGTYEVKENSIMINYFPLSKLEYLPAVNSDSLQIRFFEQPQNTILKNFKFEVLYKNGITKSLTADSLGFAFVPNFRDIKLIGLHPGFPDYSNNEMEIDNDELKSNCLNVSVNIRGWQLWRAKKLDEEETFVFITRHKMCSKSSLDTKYPYYIYDHTLDKLKFEVSKDGKFSYQIYDLADKYLLSHYKNFKWTIIDTFDTQGQDSLLVTNYDLKLHSGKNEFRVSLQSEYRFLSFLTVESNKKPVKVLTKDITDSVQFDSETFFSLKDESANEITKGYGNYLELKSLKDGIYFLEYDNNQTLKIKRGTAKKNKSKK